VFREFGNRLWISSVDIGSYYASITILTGEDICIVLSNPDSLDGVVLLPKGPLFNAAWFRDGSLCHDWLSSFPGKAASRKKVIAHISSARTYPAPVTQSVFTDNELDSQVHSP
jgi:hypothetical protein